jgi:hypothetical protein
MTYGTGGQQPKLSTLAEVKVRSHDNKVNVDVVNEPCAVCCSLGNEDDCLLCGTCDMAMHYICVGLSTIPAWNWSCPWCEKKANPTSKEVLHRCQNFAAITGIIIMERYCIKVCDIRI